MGHPTSIFINPLESESDDEVEIYIDYVQPPNTANCWETSVPGLNIAITFPDENERQLCNLDVQVEGDEYSDVVEREFCEDQFVTSAHDRAGKYDITISADGFREQKLNNVGVFADFCEVFSVDIKQLMEAL